MWNKSCGDDTSVLFETILVQKSQEDVGSFWKLCGGSYKVIGLFEMQMNSSTMLLTNKSIKTSLQSNGLCGAKIESTLEDVMLLSDMPSSWLSIPYSHLSLLCRLLLHLLHKIFLPMHLLFISHCIWALQTLTHAPKSLRFIPLWPQQLSIYLMHPKSWDVVEDLGLT